MVRFIPLGKPCPPITDKVTDRIPILHTSSSLCLFGLSSIVMASKRTIEWVLWEHKASESKNANNWKDNMMALSTFTTVEQFWKYINFIPTPSKVFFDGTYRFKVDNKTIEEYSLFKKNIEPEWGDPANAIGGEWQCRQFLDSESLDSQWQNILLSAIGETMEELIDAPDGTKTLSSVINGVRVVDKSRAFPLYRFEIWLSTTDTAVRDRVKDRLEEIVAQGQSLANRKQAPSKWEWKDHS